MIRCRLRRLDIVLAPDGQCNTAQQRADRGCSGALELAQCVTLLCRKLRVLRLPALLSAVDQCSDVMVCNGALQAMTAGCGTGYGSAWSVAQ